MKLRYLLLPFIAITLLVACNTMPEEADVIDVEEGQNVLPVFEDGIYEVDPQASSMYWEAYKLTGSHMGGIALEKGEVSVTDGQPVQGSFVINMDSITNTDIEDEGMKMNLLNHLKSDDFFSVKNYPKARFDVTRILPYEGTEDFNYRIEGDLSIKDKTKTVAVLAKIEAGEGQVNAHGKVLVNRTEFGINFRSGSFFENLGDTLIKDEFLLEMDLVARLK